MEKKQSEFNKVFSAWDILVIAFGAMIGWGWVVSSGGWIQKGGVLGAALGFVVGGVMIFFVGLTYAELTAAMPQCGGEHVWSHRAMGPTGSFVCTWAIILGYVGVACFEACAFPTIISYLWPGFLKGYLYTVAGFDIYASWLIVAILVAFGIMLINIVGAKTAAKLQTILTIIIGGAGILLIVASVINGTVDNLDGQMFAEVGGGGIVKSILSVAVISPFYLIGFDVIPQAAEEINVPPKKIGGMLILSVVLAVLFYAFVIIAVGLVMNSGTITASQAGTGLVTADAMALAFKTSVMAKVIIVGGMCGIITSWNSFMIGGSRAIYSMAESYMIPRVFAKLHPKHKTPINALILIGILTMLAPFAGRVMMVWICDAGNFGCCLAYCMVAISFLILRKKQPDMPRPYKVPAGRLMGGVAVLMSGFMVVMYCIPGSGGTLILPEWGMVAAWSAASCSSPSARASTESPSAAWFSSSRTRTQQRCSRRRTSASWTRSSTARSTAYWHGWHNECRETGNSPFFTENSAVSGCFALRHCVFSSSSPYYPVFLQRSVYYERFQLFRSAKYHGGPRLSREAARGRKAARRLARIYHFRPASDKDGSGGQGL